MNMYFIALVAPQEINDQALKWKHWFRDNFNCTVALKSPAHITLIPPFWMKQESEDSLVDSINRFSKNKKSFMISLKDFSSFKPKVIFIEVLPSPDLDKLQFNLYQYLLSENKFPIQPDERNFHPHVTLATRDLYKKSFQIAWETLAEKKYEASWKTDGISLLRHNKKNWDVIFTSQFGN